MMNRHRLSRRALFPAIIAAGATTRTALGQTAPEASPPASPVPASAPHVILQARIDSARTNHHPGPMPSGGLSYTGTILPGTRLRSHILVTPTRLVGLGADDDLNLVIDRASGEHLWSFPSTSGPIKPFIHEHRVFAFQEVDPGHPNPIRVEVYDLEAEPPSPGNIAAARVEWDVGEIYGILDVFPLTNAIIVHTGVGLTACHPTTADLLWEWLEDESSDLVSGVVADDREIWCRQWRSGSSRLVTLDPATGELLRELEPDTKITPLCMTDELVFCRQEVLLMAFNRTDGSVRWRTRVSADPTDDWAIATNGDQVVVANGHRYAAFQASTGDELWSATSDDWYPAPTSLALCGDAFVLHGDIAVEVFSATTGDLLHESRLGRGDDGRRPDEISIIDGQILVSTNEGIAVLE